MVIEPTIANRFINEYKRFLLSIYQPESADDDGKRMIEKLHLARKRFLANRGLLDEYMRTLEDGVEPIDRKILLAIRNLEYARWVYLRDLKSHSIFLEDGGGSGYGYGVLGLMDEISVMTGGPGAVLEAGVFAFDDHYVCDGLIANVVQLGPNYRRSFNELYKELLETGKFRVNPLLTQTFANKRNASHRPVGTRDVLVGADASRTAGHSPDARKQTRIDEVAALLDSFSRAHLTPELAGYARKLWDQIGRKRKYVITGGAKEVWAAAVVYVIARLNFLFDSRSPNYLTADVISAFFGTKKTTVSARAADIEKACRIRMGQDGLCSPDIADALTFVKLPNGIVIPKNMARKAGLI
jgi:hypothetical protein